MLGIWPVARITSWAGMEVPSLRVTENVEPSMGKPSAGTVTRFLVTRLDEIVSFLMMTDGGADR